MNHPLCILLALVTGMPPAFSQPRFSEKIDFPTGEGPTSLALGDLNGDEMTDIVTANYRSGSLSVLIGTVARDSSQPSFLLKRDLAVGENPMAVAVADLNGDGRPEIVAANYISNSISIFVNTTAKGSRAPSFAAREDIRTGERPYAISIVDFNGDGRPDIVVVDYKSTAVSVFLNATHPGDTSISLEERIDLPAQARPVAVAVGDLNGDGKPDIVVANYRSDSLSVFLSKTMPGAHKPSFSKPFIVAAGSRPMSVGVCDINDDGKPDIVVSDDGSNAVRVLINETPKGDSIPSFVMKAELLTGLNPQVVCCPDLNHDGAPDIVTADYNSGSLSIFFNTTRPGDESPSFSTRRELKTGTAPSSVAVGVLGEMFGEILCVANYGSNSLSVFSVINAPPR